MNSVGITMQESRYWPQQCFIFWWDWDMTFDCDYISSVLMSAHVFLFQVSPMAPIFVTLLQQGASQWHFASFRQIGNIHRYIEIPTVTFDDIIIADWANRCNSKKPQDQYRTKLLIIPSEAPSEINITSLSYAYNSPCWLYVKAKMQKFWQDCFCYAFNSLRQSYAYMCR